MFGLRRRFLVALALVLGAFTLAAVWALAMPGRSRAGPLAPLTGEQEAEAARLARDVRALCALGERSVRRPEGLRSERSGRRFSPADSWRPRARRR